MNHSTDDLESYALGLLGPEERAPIDEHVATCDACAARLAAAESVLAAMVEVTHAPQLLVRPRRIPWAAAAAAVFALSTSVLGVQAYGLRAAGASDGQRFEELVHSHFSHAQFHSASGAPLAAKVIYEAHGAWYTVVAVDARSDWRIRTTAVGSSSPSTPEAFSRRGAAAIVSLHERDPLREIELVDGAGTTLGTVRL